MTCFTASPELAPIAPNNNGSAEIKSEKFSILFLIYLDSDFSLRVFKRLPLLTLSFVGEVSIKTNKPHFR